MNIKGIDINAKCSAQDRDYERALMNAELNFWVPYVIELLRFNQI